MKIIALTAAILALAAGESFAQSQEQQVYSMFSTGRPNFQQQEIQQIQNYQENSQMGTRRVYPGREAYGREFGPLTRHPGDYRDAVDRGQWPAGGSVGGRNFSID
jgi:hypothetical protein